MQEEEQQEEGAIVRVKDELSLDDLDKKHQEQVETVQTKPEDNKADIKTKTQDITEEKSKKNM